MGSVFLSSTCHDLIDLRAELDHHLRGLGLAVVRSDAQTFTVEPDRNAVETCLCRVREAEDFVCVLSQRYGSLLGPAGYDDISPTHLEYREARQHKKRIAFFARDRLCADYSLWKQSGCSESFRPAFAFSEDALRLFRFIEEHEKLHKDAEVSNWLSQFESVVDLKAALEQRLEAPIRTAYLRRLVDEHRVPLFSLRVGSCHRFKKEVTWSVRAHNVGSQPALDVRIGFYNLSEWADAGSIAPGSESAVSFKLALPLKKRPRGNDPLLCGVEFLTPSGEKLEALFYTQVSKEDALTAFRRHSLNLVSADAFRLRVGAGRGTP